MKHFQVTLLCILIISIPAFAGVDVGNGGKIVFCPAKKNRPSSKALKRKIYQKYSNAIGAKDWNLVRIYEQQLKTLYRYDYPRAQFFDLWLLGRSRSSLCPVSTYETFDRLYLGQAHCELKIYQTAFKRLANEMAEYGPTIEKVLASDFGFFMAMASSTDYFSPDFQGPGLTLQTTQYDRLINELQNCPNGQKPQVEPLGYVHADLWAINWGYYLSLSMLDRAAFLIHEGLIKLIKFDSNNVEQVDIKKVILLTQELIYPGAINRPVRKLFEELLLEP